VLQIIDAGRLLNVSASDPVASKPFIFKANCLTWKGNALELPPGKTHGTIRRRSGVM
jgi:hypothetical protein